MDKPMPFAELRVVEISAGIAAAYCGKLFTDTGADVIKIEPPTGDPLRRWGVSGTEYPSSGVLFDFLHAGKDSVVAEPSSAATVAHLFECADLIVTDGSGGWTLPFVRELAGPDSSAVAVTVTPFGLDGPYAEADRAVNEFVLQAMCGSIEGRGWPGEMPLQAGGRTGEWVAGVYGAVAAAAAVRRSRRIGEGDVIDVSIFESMVVTMGGLGAVSASVLGARQPAVGRSLELPSIVPTADGLVGFCTITAQQFADFLVLIERPDLLDDADLASFAGRVRRRDEFREMVHAWAADRTTAEIVEIASALRIPVAPIGTPTSVADIDHFQERGVFVKNSAGRLQPRVPYRSAAFDTAPPAPPPPLGDSGRITRWDNRSRPNPGSPGEQSRPLHGLRIIDFTAFWAGPCATHTLAALGADVIKVEGLRRPDGMRFSGGLPPTVDRWWEWGPVFLASNSGKRDVTLELSRDDARELALRLIATADLVIENFSPRVMNNLGLTWDDVRAANSRAVLVRMPAFGLDGPWRDRVGFAQTMEQASGMAWMTGPADGPPIIPRGVCDPVAGLHAAFAALAALEVRDRTGCGMQIESTMVEAALNVAAEALLEAGAHGKEPMRDGNRGPGASPQGVYATAEDDRWLALAVLDDDQWKRFAALIGRPDLAGREDLATERGRRAAADELDRVVASWAGTTGVDEAVEMLATAAVAGARVTRAVDLLDDPHLVARGFWEEVEHPVVGRFRTTGMPFRMQSVDGPWMRTAAPLLGQHNSEILGEILGLTPEELRALTQTGVIGERPAGL
ncbi:CoA transferase [Nocardia sp. CA2R105]|uniref:CaiB/BaiF CoA-transferase family protein n=1 Tax=Nocardia coffeae TaxID=2873381 RepID=UPI001CA70352|nr:CoA transferase [Nocardia coffeae]MBY8856803.1 CoA transferase [Nocardia coffeae]